MTIFSLRDKTNIKRMSPQSQIIHRVGVSG